MALRQAIGGVHPEAVERPGNHIDLAQVLDPVGCCPSRHDQAGGKAVPVRQRFAIHREGDQGVFVQRLGERQALHEVRGSLEYTGVRAVERDFQRIFVEAGLTEHISEPDTLPKGIAHGAMPPLDTGHMRLEQSATVAGAQAKSRNFDDLEISSQLRQGERQGHSHRIAADPKLPVRAIDFRNDREVISHEKAVVWGIEGLEFPKRRFVVRRPVGSLDQRLLARQRCQDRRFSGASRQGFRPEDGHA